MLSYDPISFESLPLWLSFTLCLSMTAGGLLVTFRFRQTLANGNYHYLQYFLILLYVYGYYSLWSSMLLAGFMQIDNVDWVASLLVRMGTPFIIVSQLMWLIWASRIQQRPASPVVLLSAILCGVAIVAVALLAPDEPDTIQIACSAVALVCALVVAVLLVTGKQPVVSQDKHLLMVSLVLGAGLMHLTVFSPLVSYPYFDSAFVLAFYLFNTALVVVYSYHAPEEYKQTPLSLDDFLLQYGISKREADIVRGIYDGKTNQEIANQLFISLQTVKDHSSRIYQKTHVKNRAQLTTLIRDRR
ncbi:MAG: helix-turn-helix transcriptional regulator [Gammaproteobacteria bacterium]|nr:helix-turn-helix transcriptional regulator [Gammaproteobacteria bacterium]